MLAALLACAGLAASGDARGATESQPVHTSGDHQLWHRKENVVELFGHAVVSQPGETLTGDYVKLDFNSRILDAKGNCVYVSSGSVIYGDEMHFNLDTRTGTIIGGRVSNPKFALTGERINKLGEGRFQTHWGEYSTCRDCPNSWSILAEDVDMQVEGYAYMSNVTTKLDDAPAFWLPYVIVPMKTRRQTGFLFPSFSFSSQNGIALVLPFFWAVNRSSDITVGAGDYSARGPRLEVEGRYALSPWSYGKTNFYYLRDSSFKDGFNNPLPPSRYAINVGQSQELPWGFTEKLKLIDVSDNQYPTKVGDVPGSGELNLASSASLSYASPDVSGYVAARRYRTLINTVPDPALAVTQFDPRTVQAYPSAAVIANDRVLFDTPYFNNPFVFGLTVGLNNFTRSANSFDYDPAGGVPYFSLPPAIQPPYVPGVDPIRKALRLSFTPTIYTTIRPFDAFSLVPSLRYYGYFYSFPESQNFSVPNLNRGYLLFQTDFAAQIERIYENPDDKDHPRTKHLIRPLLTYSYIPFKREAPEDHPFLKQINYATSQIPPVSGYNFDDYDIVPLDNSPASTNYFIPLGNSLAMGLTTQWIRRTGAVDSLATPSYLSFIEASAGEAVNFREYEKECDSVDPGTNECLVPHNKQPLSRFFTSLGLNLGRFTYSHLYYYYPYITGKRHALTTTLNYALERGVHQGLFTFDRSVSLVYNWDQHGTSDPTQGTDNLTLSMNYSLSDYILPTGYVSYNFVGHQFLNGGAQIQFQSPSRCYKLTVSGAYDLNAKKTDSDSALNGVSFSVDLALNLTGSGFGGVTDLANQTIAPK
jgi:hypothetical protein